MKNTSLIKMLVLHCLSLCVLIAQACFGVIGEKIGTIEVVSGVGSHFEIMGSNINKCNFAVLTQQPMQITSSATDEMGEFFVDIEITANSNTAFKKVSCTENDIAAEVNPSTVTPIASPDAVVAGRAKNVRILIPISGQQTNYRHNVTFYFKTTDDRVACASVPFLVSLNTASIRANIEKVNLGVLTYENGMIRSSRVVSVPLECISITPVKCTISSNSNFNLQHSNKQLLRIPYKVMYGNQNLANNIGTSTFSPHGRNFAIDICVDSYLSYIPTVGDYTDTITISVVNAS